MAVTATIMTADREEVVDFVSPYFEQTGISIGENAFKINRVSVFWRHPWNNH